MQPSPKSNLFGIYFNRIDYFYWYTHDIQARGTKSLFQIYVLFHHSNLQETTLILYRGIGLCLLLGLCL